MAFFDWNKDGKMDIADEFMEYNIFKECAEDADDYNDSFGSDDEFFDDMDED